MPRQNRVHETGAVRNITIRGNRRQNIFEEHADYKRFERDLLLLSLKNALVLLAYCLMPNHAHIVIRLLETAAGQALQGMLTSHAVYFNRKYGRSGHLYEDRHKCDPVETDGGLQALVRYTHLNPVRAYLVGSPDDWEYSSHRAYREGGNPAVKTDFVLGMFSDDVAQARRLYREFMDQPVRPEPGIPDRLGALASHLERENGFDEGVIRGPRRPEPVARLRRAFIREAVRAGLKVKDVAVFLDRTEAAVYAALNDRPGVI